ncbi:MAG: hypothetical protein AB7S48_00750 [Bacteroidales bacterium]
MAKSLGYQTQTTETNYNLNFQIAITDEEYNKLIDIIANVRNFGNHIGIVRNIEANVIELINFFPTIFDNFDELSTPWETLDFFYLEINRRLLNYLSSIYAYFEHTEMFITQKYGRKSVFLQEFLNRKKDFINECFENRFLFELRNFSQHCGIPITVIAWLPVYENGNPKSVAKKKFIGFERNQLIIKYKKWGTLLTSEIKSKDETIDLWPILNNSFQSLKKLYLEITSKIADSYLPGVEFIDAITSNLDKTKRIIIYNTTATDDPKVYEINIGYIPWHWINEIKKSTGATHAKSPLG